MAHQSGNNRYVEQQSGPPWVYPILAVVGVAAITGVVADARAGHGLALLPLPLLALAAAANMMVMRTAVDDRELSVTFGLLPFYRRTIPLSEVQSAEAVTYNPILQYGGWGIRGLGGSRRALNMRGNRGVQLVLASGERLLIGSGRAQELLEAIRADR